MSPVNKPAWFESGSVVRNSIEAGVGKDVSFTTFRWTGKNSFKARHQAAFEFKEHIARSAKENPDAAHVIVSHSHGGSVCLHSFKFMEESTLKNLKAVICISTPFAYTTYAWTGNDNHATLFPVALVNVLTSILFIFYAEWIFDNYSLITIAVATFFTQIFVSGWFHFRTFHVKSEYYFRNPEPEPPVFMLRATRDEAALLTGFVQSINELSKFLLGTFDGSNDSMTLRTICIVFFGLLGVLMLIVVFDQTFLENVGFFSISVLVWVLMLGCAGAIYIASYMLVALSTGFTNVFQWFHHLVEVDVTPPEYPVTYKSYSWLDCVKKSSLRHGLYDSPEIQSDIISLIKRVKNRKKLKL